MFVVVCKRGEGGGRRDLLTAPQHSHPLLLHTHARLFFSTKPNKQGGSIPDAQYALVSTGEELLAALADKRKRYIEVSGDVDVVMVDRSAQPGSVAVNHIVEIRGCRRPGRNRPCIDWSNTEGVVHVTGQLLLDGDVEHVGTGWEGQGADLTAPVAALRAMPGGVIEFEVSCLRCCFGGCERGGAGKRMCR